MPNIRYRTTPFAAVPANTTVDNLLSTPDDNKQRTLKGIWCTTLVLGVQVAVLRAGYEAARFDSTIFNTALGFLPLDLSFDIGIQIDVRLINTTGGASAAGAFTVQYELPGG